MLLTKKLVIIRFPEPVSAAKRAGVQRQPPSAAGAACGGISHTGRLPALERAFSIQYCNCDKDLILKEVYKRYPNPDGSPIDVDDDNIADAINMNMIGRALLGWKVLDNQAQQAVIEDLNKPPKVKAARSPRKSSRPHKSGRIVSRLPAWGHDEEVCEMKPVTLPAHHYAAGWVYEGDFKPVAETNALGIRYAELPASQDGVKQELLLELCQAFHPYLMKYLVMICRGHLPVVGVGRRAGNVDGDVKKFLSYFLPKGQAPTRHNLSRTVRHLHLAFKGMDTEEIYDVLMSLLIAAINGYDPHYKAKVERVVEVIDRELSQKQEFTVADVNRHLDIDCDRHIRMLCRVGFLVPRKNGPECLTEGLPPPLGKLEEA
jgi:hypothetical protein